MIEYILVVTVSVLIVLGLAQRLYKPLGEFIEGFMGTYVACLLETGELPRFGSDEPVSGECRPPMMGEGEEFSLQGRAADPNNSGGGNLSDRDDMVGGNDSSSSSRSTGNTGGSGGGGKRFRVGSAGTSGMDGGGRSGKRIEVALEGGGSGAFFRGDAGGGGRSIYRQNSRYIAVTGGMAAEAKARQEREASRTSRQKVEGSENGREARNKSRPFEPPPPRKPAGFDDEIKTLDIGEIVKYVLIAGIIIILLVLLGGQALQLSKSWEKGE